MTLDEFLSGFEASRRIFDLLYEEIRTLGDVEIRRLQKSMTRFDGGYRKPGKPHIDQSQQEAGEETHSLTSLNLLAVGAD